MDPSRRDYFRDALLLRKLLGALLVAGLVVVGLKSWATATWLDLLCVVLLLGCAGGVFVVSAWLFTHHHPALSVFNDRLWYRGLREQVVMLRNVVDAEVVETKVAMWTRRSIHLTLGGAQRGGTPDDPDADELNIPLDAMAGDVDEMVELIRQRASLQRELQPARG